MFSSLHLQGRPHGCKLHGGGRFSWNYEETSDFAAFSFSNGGWVEVEAAAPKEYKGDEFIVVNFYRFVFVKNPEEEVSRHLSFMQVSLSLSHYRYECV